ncbi:hypothetical protein [Arenivirga flava]|uniref:Secreted protein n=1 Tax=Arenivirga flava TaxID=1930060 RepID=A0AA37UF95_9MICO|nr:hypothetical protein [Arenivirga flava]GMA28375.1 hypothetical protein GCM10025874_16280 [Arenivirga flava]
MTSTEKRVAVCGVTVAVAPVTSAVPAMATSPVSNPVTASLNSTAKRMGSARVGSACPVACSMVTVGRTWSVAMGAVSSLGVRQVPCWAMTR